MQTMSLCASGKKTLFEDVNIKVTEGNCYGMIGANGCRKIYFLKILSGQIEPTKGEVNITPGEASFFPAAGSLQVPDIHRICSDPAALPLLPLAGKNDFPAPLSHVIAITVPSVNLMLTSSEATFNVVLR